MTDLFSGMLDSVLMSLFTFSVPSLRSDCRHHHSCRRLHHRPGSHDYQNIEMGEEEKRVLRKAWSGGS